MTLSVIIPCYNEADVLPGFLPEIVGKCESAGWDLIVVDDGSRDGSAELVKPFESAHVRLLRHKLNRGYGAAIKTGIRAAVTDYVVTVDADGQHDPADIAKLFDKALRENADMVVGSRPGKTGSAYRHAGKAVIRFLTKLLVDVPVRDQNSGMKLYDRKSALEVLHLTPDGMAFSDVILLLFADRRMLVAEEPIAVRARQGGKSTISTRTAIDTLSEIFNLVVLFHPMKIFFPIACFFLILGVAWTIRGIVVGPSLSTGACFLLLAAMNTLLIGLIAEQFRRLNGPR